MRSSARQRRRALAPLVVLIFMAVPLLLMVWLAGPAGAKVTYNSVSFVDARHGWIAGIDGTTGMSEVWKTSDRGVSWSLKNSSVAAGAGVGWATAVTRAIVVWGNGSIWRTADGGTTWDPTVGCAAIANEASFAGTNTGWAVCSYGSSESGGTIVRITDGGATWELKKDAPGPDGSGGYWRVSAVSSSRCFALKMGTRAGVYVTSNGGATWSRRRPPRITGTYSQYRDLDFPGRKTGWVVGDRGAIAKTTDGGAHWKRQKSGTSRTLTAVCFVSASRGYVVGKRGIVLRTVDGGKHWARLKARSTKWLTGVCFVDRYHGWIVGHGGVKLRTTNGGRTWRGTH
jgi:photosystem II stability/assembly factor-like uncharacterized protein